MWFTCIYDSYSNENIGLQLHMLCAVPLEYACFQVDIKFSHYEPVMNQLNSSDHFILYKNWLFYSLWTVMDEKVKGEQMRYLKQKILGLQDKHSVLVPTIQELHMNFHKKRNSNTASWLINTKTLMHTVPFPVMSCTIYSLQVR